MKWNVGIDIGSYYVKVIEGCERNGKLVIRRIGYFPNPFPEYKNTLSEREQDVFVKKLKDFLNKHKIAGKNCVLNAGGSGIIIHYFNIPDLPKQEIESAIQLEMMQVIPGGVKNIEYDYTIFQGNDNKKTVLLVGYYREKCEFLIHTVQMAGLKPLIMDYDGLAILNSFRFLHKNQQDVISLLNIGYATTSIIFAENKDNFVLTREIPFGSKNIINTIASGKNIPEEDAEIFGKKEESKNEIKKIVSSDISDLLYETRTSMEYFKRQTGKTSTALFLTGGGSLFPGICEAFEKDMGIKTNLWNPLEVVDKENEIPLDLKSKGAIFGVALGLVVRQIK